MFDFGVGGSRFVGRVGAPLFGRQLVALCLVCLREEQLGACRVR